MIRMRRYFVIILCWCAALCLYVPTALGQQTRIAVGAGGGVVVPFGPSERFVPRWHDPEFNGVQAPTQLVHYRPKPGMAFHLETTIRALNIRYTFQRYLWKQDRVACVPRENSDGTSRYLPNGEFDDRSMDYACSGAGDTISHESGRRALLIHQLNASYSFAAIRPRVVIPYAKVGGGLLLTTFHPSVQNNSVRLGVSVLAGGGLRVPIDRNVTLYVEAQYGLHIMSRGGDYSLRAGRAVAADKTVLSTLFDPMHTLQAIVGIRVRVR